MHLQWKGIGRNRTPSRQDEALTSSLPFLFQCKIITFQCKMKKIDIKAGDRFGMLTVIREETPNITPGGTKQRKFLVKCDCGREKTVSLFVLTSKKQHVASCGCSYDLASYTRKYTKEQKHSFLYTTWRGMKQRCKDKGFAKYACYGGRGITICDEWDNNYISFYNWAIANGASKQLTLDRIDVNGNYEPSNCRWVDNATQQRNKQYNRYLEYNGVKKLLREWAEELDIPYDTIRHRLDHYGYTVAESLGFELHKSTSHKERPWARKKVIQYSLNGGFIREWDSLYDIRRELGFSEHSVRQCCAGYTLTSYGYKWKFKGEENKRKGLNKPKKSVLQYTLEGQLIAEYSDVREAAAQAGACASNIMNFCNGNANNSLHCGGYLWAYKGSGAAPQPAKISREQCSHHHRLEYNGKTMRILDWARETGIRTTTIESRLKNGWPIGEALGFEHHARNGSKYVFPVLQYDKDMNLVKEYRSLHFVRKEAKRDKKAILRYIENGELDNQGYYWRYKKD